MRAAAAIPIAIVACACACRCDKQRPAPSPVPRAEAAAVAPEVAEGGAVLVGSRGSVELQRGTGPWGPAAQGQHIGVSDGLRTPQDGEAELSVDGIRVKLHDRSEIRLTAASSGVLRGRVRGRVESEVDKGKGRVSLQVEGGETVAD